MKTAWWLSWGNLVLTVLLRVSPWLLGFDSQPKAKGTALASGVVVGGLALAMIV